MVELEGADMVEMVEDQLLVYMMAEDVVEGEVMGKGQMEEMVVVEVVGILLVVEMEIEHIHLVEVVDLGAEQIRIIRLGLVEEELWETMELQKISLVVETAFALYNIIRKGLINMIHSHKTMIHVHNRIIFAPPPEWHSSNALKIFEEGAHKRHSPIKESVSFYG